MRAMTTRQNGAPDASAIRPPRGLLGPMPYVCLYWSPPTSAARRGVRAPSGTSGRSVGAPCANGTRHALSDPVVDRRCLEDLLRSSHRPHHRHRTQRVWALRYLNCS